jgi:HPt (histidine-containing phosphotransfer) domain-containing protein
MQPLPDTSASEVLNHEQIASVNEMDPSGDFLGELVASFTRNVTGLLARLNAAAQEQNADEFARMAHQIKGLAANLGADTLAKTSLALEMHSQQHGLTEVGDLLKTLSQDFQHTLAAFDAVLAKLRVA